MKRTDKRLINTLITFFRSRLESFDRFRAFVVCHSVYSDRKTRKKKTKVFKFNGVIITDDQSCYKRSKSNYGEKLLCLKCLTDHFLFSFDLDFYR